MQNDPLRLIKDMSQGKKINFFEYMDLGGFRPLQIGEDFVGEAEDIIFSLVMTIDQYDKFLQSKILVFEIAELKDIIGDMVNKGIITAVKMEVLNKTEFGVTFVKEFYHELAVNVYNQKDEKYKTNKRLLT